MKKITVTIDKLGMPVIEAHGFDGCGCTEATKPLEEALSASGEPAERIMKDEWTGTEKTKAKEYERSW